MIVILGIPTLTIGKNFIQMDEEVIYAKDDVFLEDTMVQDELAGGQNLSVEEIAQINREEQVKMQEAIQQETEGTVEEIMQTEVPITETVSLEEENKEQSEGNFLDTLKQSVDSFTGDLALMEEAAKVNSNITSALADDAYIESDQVLAGKGGWLFYKRADDGTPLQDYQGTSAFSEKTMEKIKNQLLAQRDTFAAKGIRYVVMIVPNKEIMYSEFMPSTVYRTSEITRCDKLYEYLVQNTNLEVVYPKQELYAAKEMNQIYYKYDTHWNRLGSFVGVQSVLKQLYGNYQTLADVEIIEENMNTSGDLAALIGMTDKYCDDSYYSINRDSYDVGQKVEDRLLVVGDSFSTLMMDDLKYYFQEAKQVGVWTFKMSMLDSYQPNVILWECAERYADRLSWIDLIKK